MLIISLVALPHAAGAQTGETVRGACQATGCDEFTVVSKQAVAKGADGELFQTRVRVSRAGAAATEEDGHVYCSTSRPAVINAPSGAKGLAYFLAPDEVPSADTLRVSTNFFALYFTLCHDAATGRAAVADRVSTARSLNYNVSARQAQTAVLNGAEDVLQAR